MRLALPVVVLLAVSSGDVRAGEIAQALWDAHGCWIDRAPRDPPARLDREQLGGARAIRGKQPRGYVAFTFDDGPSEDTTMRVLDALGQHDVPATFFVVGWRLQAGRRGAKQRVEILGEIARRGHLIGNHTYRHPRLDQLSAKRQRAEIDRTQGRIQNLLGFRPYLFRAPYGRMTGGVRRHLARRNYTEVGWSIDPEDFLVRDTERLRRRVVSKIVENDGGVVLLHDTKPWTARALPSILDDLLAENCRRRKTGKTLIVPVSLHYFIRDSDGEVRPLPEAVTDRTKRYRRRLKSRCEDLIDKGQATN